MRRMGKVSPLCTGPVEAWLTFFITTPGWNANGANLDRAKMQQVFPTTFIGLVGGTLNPSWNMQCWPSDFYATDKGKWMALPEKDKFLRMPTHGPDGSPYEGHHVLVTQWQEQCWEAPDTSFWSCSDLNFGGDAPSPGPPTPGPPPPAPVKTCSWCKTTAAIAAAVTMGSAGS